MYSIMYSINMKLWDCHCGTGKNCGSCPYGTFHYCTKCYKIKSGHKEESCPFNKNVNFSVGPIYIPSNDVYKLINKSSVIKPRVGLDVANKNGLVIIFNKSMDNKLFVLLQMRGPNKAVCPNAFGVPGGKRENNETDLDAVIRETYEEVGYSLDPNKLIKFKESNKCGWFVTCEYIYEYKLTRKPAFNELGLAPFIEMPYGLANPPYGHFWINIKDIRNYFYKKEIMFGLEKNIYEASKYF